MSLGYYTHGASRAFGWAGGFATGLSFIGTAGSYSTADFYRTSAEKIDDILQNGTDISIDGNYRETLDGSLFISGGSAEYVRVDYEEGDVSQTEYFDRDTFQFPENTSELNNTEILQAVSEDFMKQSVEAAAAGDFILPIVVASAAFWATMTASSLIHNKVRTGNWDGYGW